MRRSARSQIVESREVLRHGAPRQRDAERHRHHQLEQRVAADLREPCHWHAAVRTRDAAGPLRPTAVRLIVIGLRRRDRDLRLQLQEVLLPDAADVHQLLDLLERAVLLPVLDDARGGLGADARQPFEIGRRRGVQIDDGGGGGLGGGAGGALGLGGRAPAARRADTRERRSTTRYGTSNPPCESDDPAPAGQRPSGEVKAPHGSMDRARVASLRGKAGSAGHRSAACLELPARM